MLILLEIRLQPIAFEHSRNLIDHAPVSSTRHADIPFETANLWEFPGGKVEAGETYFEAAMRELAEELDVSVVSVARAIFSVTDPGSEFLIEFVPTTIHGSPACLEHMDLKWISLSDLPSLELAPSDRRFVDFLRSSQ